ncbi:MAG: AAA family ATPase [Candidatus Lokiarchaeia archaeon]
MELPKTKVKAESINPGLMVLYSKPKIGKTTLLSKLDDCLIIDLEEGTKYLDALKVKINSLEELQELGEKIISEGKPYKYVAIDTATALEDMVAPEANAMYRATPMGKNFDPNEDVLNLPRGAGYLYYRRAYLKWLNKLIKLAPHVILVGHLKDSMIEKNGKEVEMKDLDLTGKLKSIVCSQVDAIAYMYRDADSNLVMNFKGSEQVTCGARPNHLKGQEITVAGYDSTKNDLVNIQWDKIYLK